MSTTTVEWSTRACQPPQDWPLPPLPGSAEFRGRVRGRAGDLIVQQVRSSLDLTSKQADSLRTLGLKGPGSTSLRDSSDGITWGLIAAVRQFVGVVELNGVFCKSRISDDMEYEHTDYGSNTRPGGLTRNALGNFFSFESDRSAILVAWDTGFGIDQTIKAFSECYGDEAISDAPLRETSSVGLSIPVEVAENLTNYVSDGESIVEGPTLEVLRLVNQYSEFVRLARLAFVGAELTWQEPQLRFEDRDLVAAEIGLYSHDLDVVKAKQFAIATGSELIRDAELSIQVRRQGILRELSF